MTYLKNKINAKIQNNTFVYKQQLLKIILELCKVIIEQHRTCHWNLSFHRNKRYNCNSSNLSMQNVKNDTGHMLRHNNVFPKEHLIL